MADVAAEIKDLGDKIANLTLKQAKELSDYLKEEYKIEPAAAVAGDRFKIQAEHAADALVGIVRLLRRDDPGVGMQLAGDP